MATLLQKVIDIYKRTLLAQEPSLFTVCVGAFDIFDDETTAEFKLEYIFPERQKIGIFAPFI